MNEKTSIKILNRKYPEIKKCILLGYRGSIAHGMYIPNTDLNSIDDKDLMGIIIPNKDIYIGLKKWGSRGTKEIFYNEWDVVLYEIKKYINLLLKSNPNVLSLLWLRENLYIKKTIAGQKLIDNRNIFISKKCYHSFSGYAYGQLHRMTHYKFEGYMGEKRKKLVMKYGYDCKNASHLIRLLRMGIELLNEGNLYVTRKDATQLLEIKKGEWTLEQIKNESDKLFKRIETCYDSSKLKNEPDYDKANDLCMEILKEHMDE